MNYSIFVKKAIEKDSRNTFVTYADDISKIPTDLQMFYQSYNPVNVEIDTDNGLIHFYPAEDLTELSKDYSYIGNIFVFATINSDPIFINDKIVYTCPHGINNPKWEKVAESFEEYIQGLLR